MSPPDLSAPSIVDVDAEVVFRHPLVIVLVVTFVVGALDALGYQAYGVFTANQAGNLVIVWTLMPAAPAAAGLALASLVGCASGVAAVILLRRSWTWLVTPTGSRALLLSGSGLILLAQLAARSLSDSGAGVQPAAPWSAAWWPQAGSIVLVAFSIAVLGMVFISGGGVRAPILASTNAFVDAVRYAVAGSVVPARRAEWWARVRTAGGFPIAWTAGAATAALLPASPLAISVGVAALVAVIALFARRVSGADSPPRPTV